MSGHGGWDVALLLLLGALLPGAIGAEREWAGQDAGFRTHLLVGLGAALFGSISVDAFDAFVAGSARTNVQVDVTRVASYVAPGIGFIGGGAILKHRGTVRGITTATSLWTAAAIGLACGVGFVVPAITTTAVALVALAALKPLSNWIDRRRHPPATLVVTLAPGAGASAIIDDVRAATTASINEIRLSLEDEDSSELSVRFWSRPDRSQVDALTARIEAAHRASIRSITITS